MIPGLQQESAAARKGDARAVWSIAVAPLAARWALGAGARPCRDPGDLPSTSVLRHVALEFGRIPGSFLLAEADSFVGRFCAAISSETALAAWLAPLLAAGLFGVERGSRKPLLAQLSPDFGWRTRRVFQRLRVDSPPRPEVAEGAAGFLERIATDDGGSRHSVVAMLADEIGEFWLDELAVLAHHRLDGWRVGRRTGGSEGAAALAWWSEGGANV